MKERKLVHEVDEQYAEEMLDEHESEATRATHGYGYRDLPAMQTRDQSCGGGRRVIRKRIGSA